jgi:nicotinate-nucleotide adenylyltransferase
MTQLAIQNHPHFQLDTTDSDRPPPHTTVSLIPLLQARYPHAQIWWLVGGDSLRDLPTWVEPQTLIQRCRLAALPRPGTTIDWEPLIKAIPQIKERVDLLDGPVNALSSTAIRAWVRKGNSIRFLADTAVIDYIHTHNLYK